MSARKYLILCAVILFGATGDVVLSRGMKQVGNISIHDLPHLVSALASPWIICGILLLMAFMASYLTALSWADLTYVLPATAGGYILMALLAKYFLHENISAKRWIGILMIVAGVGFVAGGPSFTPVHGGQSAREGSA